MTKYTLHSRSHTEIEIHKDGEQVAIMKGKGSFFQRTRQWTARDNNGKTAAVGRSFDDCLKHYAATQGDNRIEQQPHTQGTLAIFTSLTKEEV